jgi:2-octaprenylphenol hydroxylase
LQSEQPQNIDLLSETRCRALQRDNNKWLLTLDDAQQIRVDLLVGADGSQSWLRQQLGWSVRGWDYNQHALVTTVKTSRSHQQTAWQRFLPDGPLAFLPLLDKNDPDHFSSIVWSAHPDHAQALLAMDEDQFRIELEQAYTSRLGEIESVAQRFVFPLRFLNAEHYIGEGIALVGDAAHTMHPLAGQGVNLGLADAASLAQILIQHRDRRRFASYQALRPYERWRRAENMTMLTSVDQLQHLFSASPPWLQWLRVSGMSLFNRLPLVKNTVIQFAMGNKGDLPLLARGIPLNR